MTDSKIEHRDDIKDPVKTKGKTTKKDLKEFTDKISDAGDDVLVIDHETSKRVHTKKRKELLEVIRDEEIKSIRDLARKVDRDPSVVLDDIRTLFEYSIIDVEKDGNRKIPKLKHDKIVVAEELI